MENSEKGLFSPSKSTANFKSSFVGENNENDSCQYMMDTKSQNHKKIVVKRFMSPTISAASKAAPSRKKILVDRNENLITSYDQNHSRKGNGDFDGSRSTVFSPNSRHNEPNPVGEMENKATVNGSSVNAYNPSNNYLSPRPRFLRFNPNKRSEIFNGLDREGFGVLENGSLGSLERSGQEDSSEEAGKIAKVSPFKENNAESNDTEIPNGGEDDVDDDDDDDVDCDDEDEYEEELEKDKEGRCFRGVIKILLTTLACLLSVSYICFMNSPSSSVSSNGMWNLSNGYVDMIKEEQSFEPINIYGPGLLANQPEYDFSGAECAEFEEDDDEDIEESFNPEIPEDEVSDVYGNNEEVASDAYIEVMDMVEKDVGIEEVRSSDNSELKEEKPDESMDFDRSSLEAENPDIALHDEASNQSEAEDSKVMDDHHETYEEFNVGSTEDLTEPGHETDGSLMQKTKWDSSSTTIIGFSLTSMILAPLALFYYSKKKKIARAKEPRSRSRSYSEKQQHNFVSEDKAMNPMEKKVEFLARSVQHNILMKESYETIKDDINAPSVELLGEIVIGQVNNLRICREAYKVNELKEVNTHTFFTNQVSLALSDSTPTQPSSRVHSTGTESKSLRSKVRDAEEAMTDVTPLRRSARLRNRTTITSPSIGVRS